MSIIYPKCDYNLYTLLIKVKELTVLKEFEQKIVFCHHLAKGVRFLHQKGTSHGNLKPTNILCNIQNGDNNVKPLIADWESFTYS